VLGDDTGKINLVIASEERSDLPLLFIGRRRARRSAREAGYWKHQKHYDVKILECFKSANTPPIIRNK